MNKQLFFGEFLLKRCRGIKLLENLEGFYLMRLEHRDKRRQRRKQRNTMRKKKSMMKKKNKSQKRNQKKKYQLNQKMIKLTKMKTLNHMNMIVITIQKVTTSGVKKVLIGNFIMKKIKLLMKVDYHMNHMIYLTKNKLLMINILTIIINKIERS